MSRRGWLRALMVVVFGLAAPPMLYGQTGHPTFLSPHASPIALASGRVFVANTPADTLDVIDASSLRVVARVHVGVDPVGVAVRPDGREVWVANHVSDSVSVVDADPASATYLQVIATVQAFDSATRATRFDEPAGVAFASDTKAYVALSSENQVAVVDVGTRQVIRRLTITAQDPRALAVRGDRLYVVPFESNNQTQLSGCVGPIDGDLCTFDAREHVVDNNNVLSLNYDADIVKNPLVPDRDLFVFDTTTDELVETVDGLGTLLYGLAVDSTGRVFVAQTDARNDANGRAGTRKDGLAELENRAFLNRITRVDCAAACGAPEFIDLEPRPPEHPAPGLALATPYAVQISADDSTLVVTAAGSDWLFTVDPASGAVLGRAAVGAVPRGIALESSADGRPVRAWVLNAADDTVSLVELSDLAAPVVTATITLEDPTHPAVKRGRIAFNDADASTTGTFSCESCHADGHTDQLLWVLDTPICDRPGCTQIPPRATMPVRGLRDTAPYHWDGIPGDPYGGNNTANINGDVAANCDPDVPESCTRGLVDGSLESTMCLVGDCPVNDEGKPGALTRAERDDLATFLLSVPYPPAQRRSYDNVLSSAATTGFQVFHVDGVPPSEPSDGRPNVCGNCHRMPFWVSTNTPGTGMDAPTWRGAYDRWLILPQGRWNVVDLRGQADREAGFPERSMWGAARGIQMPFWNMVTEGSTGFSGAFGRTVTLNRTASGDALTVDLLNALELADEEGGVQLQGEGVFVDGVTATPVRFEFEAGQYLERDADPETFTRAALMSLAAAGRFVGSFTGRLGANIDVDHPQPALWTLAQIQVQQGRQVFPALFDDDERPLRISGRHIQPNAHLWVDGRRVPGVVRCQTGTLPDCHNDWIEVALATLPSEPGIHFLQVQNPDGLVSNEFIFFRNITATAQSAGGTQWTRADATASPTGALAGSRPRGPAAGAGETVATATDGTRFEARPIATGLDTPTSLAFAPDGRLFIAERPGRVRVVDRGQLRRAPALTLDDVSVGDGAGLLGLTLDPAFADNGFVYLFYTRARSGAPPAQRVVRYREVANVLSQPVVLLDDLPAGHDRGGGGLRVGPDGLLYVSVGDGGVADAAQDLASYAGKILRVRRDGTTPRGNPFMSPIYAVGYRNPLGLAWHPSTGELWATDRGRPGTAGGDEVNLVRAGANHGWPMAEGLATRPGMERPALLLSASPGPAGLAFYDAEAIPGFRNDLFLAAQTGAHLLRVRFDPREPRRIIATERLLDGRFGRLRDVIIGPDGALYVATGNGSPDAPDGQIIRLGPP